MGLALHNKGYGHMGIFELHGSFNKQRGHHDGGGGGGAGRLDDHPEPWFFPCMIEDDILYMTRCHVTFHDT